MFGCSDVRGRASPGDRIRLNGAEQKRLPEHIFSYCSSQGGSHKGQAREECLVPSGKTNAIQQKLRERERDVLVSARHALRFG